MPFWRTRYSAKPPTAARPAGSMPISLDGLGLTVRPLEAGTGAWRRLRSSGVMASIRSPAGLALILCDHFVRRQRDRLPIRVEDRPATVVVLDEAVHAVGVDDHVGEQAVQPVLELGAEAAHDRVDDDERRHAEHDADDADERQVAGPQVPDAEQQLVHGRVPFRVLRRAGQCAHAGCKSIVRGCNKFRGTGKGEVRRRSGRTCELRSEPRSQGVNGARPHSRHTPLHELACFSSTFRVRALDL